jgi:xanthine dehydrogenase accessory factor
VTNIYKKLYDALKEGHEAALITRVAPDAIEKRLLLDEQIRQSGLTGKLAENSLAILEGEAKTVLELFKPKPRLVVFGGGHVAAALAPMAVSLDFDLIVYDDRPSFSSPARFPMASRTFCEPFDEIGKNVALTSADFVVIATRGHRHDEDCLKFVLSGTEPFYVGMIGSKRRTAIARKTLSGGNWPAGSLERLHSPIGLDIKATTPAEIAVSILAEMIKARRLDDSKRGLGGLELFPDMELVSWLAREERENAALVTVVASKGSTPRKAGAKMAVFFDNRSLGSIGGGCAEAEVMVEARSLIGTGAWSFRQIDLTDKAEEDGMVCGGTMEVMLEDLA